MAVRKISEFEEVLSLKDNDRILLERNGEPKFIKASNLLSYFNIEAPTFSGVINITGDQVLNTGGDNIFAYDKCEGIYNWVSSRDFENITITYKGNIYKYTTKVAGEYLGLFITEFSEEGYIQIYGQTANASTFDFTLMIMSDNVTSNSFPEEVKEKDNVVLYCGDIFGILNTDLPVTFNVENNRVVSAPTFNIIDNKVDITFDKNSVIAWANMPNEHWTDKNEKNGYLRVNVPGLYDWIDYNSYGGLSRLKLTANNKTYNFCQNAIYSNSISSGSAFTMYPNDTDNSLLLTCEDPDSSPSNIIYVASVSPSDLTDSMSLLFHKDDFALAVLEGPTLYNMDSLPINISFERITGNENPVENSITDNEVNLTFTSDNIKTIESMQMAVLHLDGISDWLNRKRLSQAVVSLEGYDCTYKNAPAGTSFPYEGFQHGPYDSNPNLTMIMACTIGVARAFLLFANQDTSMSDVEISKDDILLDSSNLFSQDFNIDDLPLHIKIFCDFDINTEDDYVEDNEINLNFKGEDIKSSVADGITFYYCLKNLSGITDWLGNKAPSDISLYINDVKYEFSDNIDSNPDSYTYEIEDTVIDKKEYFSIMYDSYLSRYNVSSSDYVNGYSGSADGAIPAIPASIYGYPYKVMANIYKEPRGSDGMLPSVLKDDIILFIDYYYTSLMPKDFPLNIRFEFNDNTVINSNKIDVTFNTEDVTNVEEGLSIAIKNIPGCLDWFENKNSSYIKAKINGVVYQNIISTDTGDADLPISGTQRYWSITELADEPGVKGINFLNNNSEDPLYLMRIGNDTSDSYGVTLKKDDFIIAIGGMSYLKAEDLPLNIEFIYEEPIFSDLNYIKEREVNVTFKEAENANIDGEAFMYTSVNVPGLSDWLQSKDFSKIILSINGREYSSTTDNSESLFKYTLTESSDEDKDSRVLLSLYYDYIYNSEAIIAIEAIYIAKQAIGDIGNPLLNNMAKDTIRLVDLAGATDTVLPLNIKFIYAGE